MVFLRVFYTGASFKEAPGDIGFPVFAAIHCVASFCLFWSFLSFLVSMHLRPRGSVRMRRPEMIDGAPAQSAGRFGESERWEMDPTDGSVVHLVLACTPCRWDRGCVWRLLYIDDLLAGKEDCIENTITVFIPLFWQRTIEERRHRRTRTIAERRQ